MNKNILIGGAWPYANSDLHLGHIAGLISGDVLARYFRLKGYNVMYVSGTDCHGTPITERAKKEKKTPKEIAVSITAEIIKTAAAHRPEYRLESGDRERLMKMRGRTVCALITEKRGSAPRGKGAYIFVSADGVTGTVGGGKWEADVLSDARAILKGCEAPGMRTYSSVTEDALCGGEIDVLFEVEEL